MSTPPGGITVPELKPMKVRMPDMINPFDITLKVVSEPNSDDYRCPIRYFTEQQSRNYSDYNQAQQLVASQNCKLAQIHYTSLLPFVTLSQDIFIRARVNEIPFELVLDTNDRLVIAYCFLRSESELLFLSREVTLEVFRNPCEYVDIYDIICELPWSTVLASSRILEHDVCNMILMSAMDLFIDKRNRKFRLLYPFGTHPLDMKPAIALFDRSSEAYHIALMERDKRESRLLLNNRGSVSDIPNELQPLLSSDLMCHNWLINVNEDDNNNNQVGLYFEQIEVEYKMNRDRLRKLQMQMQNLLDFSDGKYLSKIMNSRVKYHVIFLGSYYSDPLSLKSWACEHVKFVHAALGANYNVISFNQEVILSRTFSKIGDVSKLADNSMAPNYYMQHPVSYKWHNQLSRIADIYGIEYITTGCPIIENLEKRALDDIQITSTYRVTTLVLWLN